VTTPILIRFVCRYVCEVATILGVLSYVILQQGDEIRNQGVMAFLKQQVMSIFLLYVFCFANASFPVQLSTEIDLSYFKLSNFGLHSVQTLRR
jgi:hypothetical protein